MDREDWVDLSALRGWAVGLALGFTFCAMHAMHFPPSPLLYGATVLCLAASLLRSIRAALVVPAHPLARLYALT